MMESYVTRSRQRFGVEFFRNLLTGCGKKHVLLRSGKIPNVIASAAEGIWRIEGDPSAESLGMTMR
jgi:hypothetical protein